jgi:molecular chaperone DnaJ
MEKRDYYEALGIHRNASKDEINSAFRRLARQYHPDVNDAPDAEDRFKEINEAKDVLLDDQKRAAYDRFGHAGVSRVGGVPDYSTMDFSSIFEELFGFGFGGSPFRQSRRRNIPRKGYDLQYNLTLTFDEAVYGAEKEIKITRDEICTRCDGDGTEPGFSFTKCPTCDGAGEVRQGGLGLVFITTCPKCRGEGKIIEKACSQCNGRGLERKTVPETVKVPAGIDNGRQIRIREKGQPGINGGPNGDVYIAIRIKPHKFFRRQGNNILLDLDINIPQAVLGADVTIPTIDGDDQLSIPSGAQAGQVLRMRGKGVPDLHGNGRGDQLVILNIVVPKRLSPEQRELFEQLSESMGSEVRPQERGFFDRLKEVLGG